MQNKNHCIPHEMAFIIIFPSTNVHLIHLDNHAIFWQNTPLLDSSQHSMNRRVTTRFAFSKHAILAEGSTRLNQLSLDVDVQSTLPTKHTQISHELVLCISNQILTAIRKNVLAFFAHSLKSSM